MNIKNRIQRLLDIRSSILTKNELELIRTNKDILQKHWKEKNEVCGYIGFNGKICDVTFRVGDETSVKPEIQTRFARINFHTHPAGSYPEPSDYDRKFVFEQLNERRRWLLCKLKYIVISKNGFYCYGVYSERFYPWEKL